MAPFAHLIRAIALTSTLEPRGMTYRDNEIVFSGNSPQVEYWVRSGQFTMKDFSVTSGQDPDKQLDNNKVYTFNAPKEGYADKTQKFTFKVGRKGSSEVANWWKSNFPPNRNTFGKNPDDLNFAVKGDMTLKLNDHFTVNVPNIGLGQGSAGARNNWWFGGSDCESVSLDDVGSKYVVRCPGTNQDGARIHVLFRRGMDVTGMHEVEVYRVDAY